MSERFTYVKYDEVSIGKQETFKKLFEEIERFAEVSLKDSREKSLFMTAIEEAYMWTGKAIRNEKIIERSQPEHVAERG